MTHVDWDELSREIDDKPTWNAELYKKKIMDFAKATWRIVYKDGSHIDGSNKPNDDAYLHVKRTGVKSISVIYDGKPIHTVQVKDDWFAIRRKNLGRFMANLVGTPDEFSIDNPKRGFILATHDGVSYVWDDGDIDELDDFGDQAPYLPLELVQGEK